MFDQKRLSDFDDPAIDRLNKDLIKEIDLGVS
jgi:hypothetical protein